MFALALTKNSTISWLPLDKATFENKALKGLLETL
jgi:hypothetical protein